LGVEGGRLQRFCTGDANQIETKTLGFGLDLLIGVG
jgi:hypothetical protein